MGSSCTSGKQKKPRNVSSSNSNTTKSSPKQFPTNVPSVFYHQVQKQQQDLTFEDKNSSNKVFSKYLSAANTAYSNETKSSQHSSSTNSNVPQEQKTKILSQAQAHSENIVFKKRKITQLENFIIERKKYMQERGIAVYTPYTILPPPVLKSVKSSSLQQKRTKSLSIQNLRKDVCQNKLQSRPANMLNGDMDAIAVEI
ncbi:hypothetical protein ABPG72_014802 [Tetrahymena utriculariae]